MRHGDVCWNEGLHHGRPARAARTEAFDRILRNHELYCTVCDNNNGNCTVHNTTKLVAGEHQRYPFQGKPYPVDNSNPFYRYDPNQCILCGRCVQACEDLQVNEALSVRWEDPHPRVLWDGGAAIGESSCVSCGHCATVCPCNALMEKTMLGHGGLRNRLQHSGFAQHDRRSSRYRRGWHAPAVSRAAAWCNSRRGTAACVFARWSPTG